MSYSVSNINNLRFLYCNSDIETNNKWEQVKNSLEVNFDNTIDATFNKKYELYFTALLVKIINFLDASRWRYNSYSLESRIPEEKILTLLYQTHKDELGNYIVSIISELAHGFHYELLRLSDSGCEKLAHIHFLPIKDCLQKWTNDSSRDLLALIKDTIDPDPKREVISRIDYYINERSGRLFRSSHFTREDFLKQFKLDLNAPNVDLRVLIDKISLNILFKNDWMIDDQGSPISDTNPSLSFYNPFIKGLEIYKDNNEHISNVEIGSERPMFNNPLFTIIPWSFLWPHIPMKNTSEDITLLLMRLHIKQISNKNDGISRKITETSLKVIQNMRINNNVDQKFINLRLRLFGFQMGRSTQIERRERMNEMMPQGGA